MASDDSRPWATGATEAERWDGYLDTDTGMLRTLSEQPIRSADELREFEDSRVQLRALELKANPIEGDFGLEHLQAIHRHLFQDVYPWAGEIRTVGIKKGEDGFLPPEHAAFVVTGAARLMREDGMLRPGMDSEKWSSLLAERFNDVNEAHPFREGNGRTQRLYFDQVAEAGGKTIHQRPHQGAERRRLRRRPRRQHRAAARRPRDHGHRPDGPARDAARQASRRGHARQLRDDHPPRAGPRHQRR